MDLIQDDTILGNSDKMLFHTKELVATISDPKLLSKHSFALRLLQYVRDESHRFAQNYHHILRKKSTLWMVHDRWKPTTSKNVYGKPVGGTSRVSTPRSAPM